MATPILITRDNFNSPVKLKRSTQGREGTPDGNIFIDMANDRIQLITVEENALIDFGSGLEANPFTNETKIQNLAIYFFIKQETQLDPVLQNYTFSIDAVPNRMGKLVGATSYLNSIKLASGAVNANGVGGSLGDDRLKLADSGVTEYAVGGDGLLIDRVYHCPKSLNSINANSQAFYQVADSLSEADRQAAPPIDFSNTGAVNGVIQTFGTTANGDTTAGDFDSRNKVLILGVRDYGYSVGEVNSIATGVTELGAISYGYGLGNSVVSEVAVINEADVWGGSQVAPFTGLSFMRLATPEVVGGFVEADGNFTDKIINTGGATLIQIRAWLDKLMQQDTNQNTNSGVTGTFLPKRAEPLYTINAANGKLVGRKGLMIENINSTDLVLTDDAGLTKTRPITTSVTIFLSNAWFADPSPWFRLMYADGAGGADFDTASSVTVKDANGDDVAGTKTDPRIFAVTGGYELRFSYAYDLNTQAGLSASADKPVVFLASGVSNTKDKDFYFTISNTALTFDASTSQETN